MVRLNPANNWFELLTDTTAYIITSGIYAVLIPMELYISMYRLVIKRLSCIVLGRMQVCCILRSFRRCMPWLHVSAIVASSALWVLTFACTDSANCCVLQCNNAAWVRRHSNAVLLSAVQLRLPDIEKTYLDLVMQHRAGYKQRWAVCWPFSELGDWVSAKKTGPKHVLIHNN